MAKNNLAARTVATENTSLKAELERLKAENEALKAGKKAKKAFGLRMGEKGGIVIEGCGGAYGVIHLFATSVPQLATHIKEVVQFTLDNAATVKVPGKTPQEEVAMRAQLIADCKAVLGLK